MVCRCRFVHRAECDEVQGPAFPVAIVAVDPCIWNRSLGSIRRQLARVTSAPKLRLVRWSGLIKITGWVTGARSVEHLSSNVHGPAQQFSLHRTKMLCNKQRMRTAPQISTFLLSRQEQNDKRCKMPAERWRQKNGMCSDMSVAARSRYERSNVL